eukprot:365861-Chlamydomonas_euryale.AAC.37
MPKAPVQSGQEVPCLENNLCCVHGTGGAMAHLCKVPRSPLGESILVVWQHGHTLPISLVWCAKHLKYLEQLVNLLEAP